MILEDKPAHNTDTKKSYHQKINPKGILDEVLKDMDTIEKKIQLPRERDQMKGSTFTQASANQESQPLIQDSQNYSSSEEQKSGKSEAWSTISNASTNTEKREELTHME